jgi:hypothetical protein
MNSRIVKSGTYMSIIFLQIKILQSSEIKLTESDVDQRPSFEGRARRFLSKPSIIPYPVEPFQRYCATSYSCWQLGTVANRQLPAAGHIQCAIVIVKRWCVAQETP